MSQYQYKHVKYPVIKNNSTSQDSRYNGIGQEVLMECDMMKISRQYKETEWKNNNQAYQAIIDVYKQAFDQNKSPETLYKDYFNSDEMTDIKLPMEFAIINRKLTYIISNAPKAKWVSLTKGQKDVDRQSSGKQFGYIFDYVFYLSDGDWEQFKTIISSLIYSIGYTSYFHEYYVQEVEMPADFQDGMLIYKTVTKIVSHTVVRNEDVRHILLDYNASDLRDVEKGGIIRHYSEAKFKKLFANSQYSIDGIQPINPQECFQKIGEGKSGANKKLYETLYYYDEGMDRFAIIVNGYHINPYRSPRVNPENEGWSPIPSRDKKFPVAFWIDHYLDSELYGMGECTLARPFREIKNKTRNMVFDVMKKVAFSTIAIDPLSTFDESEYVFGQPFVRIDPDEMQAMPVNANLDFTNQMDQQTNEDVAVFTGINILDTANPTGDETATKTAARRESQFATIENYIKQNMTNGWKRLWLGMKETILLGYSVPMLDEEGNSSGFIIRTDGVKLFRNESNGKISEQKMEGSYFFETTPDDYNNDMELIPEMSNVAYTKELEDEQKREGLTILEAYPSDSGVVNLFKAGELRAELANLPKDLINPSPVQDNSDIDLNQDAKDITKNLDLIAKPPQYDELASKMAGQQENPQGETPSRRIPEAGALPGIQAPGSGNPAVVS